MKHVGTEVIIITAIALSFFGCAWVSVTDEGQAVRVLQPGTATGCEKIGNVTANTTDHVTIFARSDRKIQQELESLARNEATELGGDAIVPVGSAKEGRQSFDVYRCRPR
ncbi:MAG: DUF4156 domain-containing protein [Deltaproteobacteria bacterium]|nr:DUF4156 domain-containing protein [Deltaproteobacteria bacterium]